MGPARAGQLDDPCNRLTMTHRDWLALAWLAAAMATAMQATAQPQPTLRDRIDRFTTAGQNDYAACAQHIALEHQWSAFLHVAPSAGVTACAGDLRARYDADGAALEGALRDDKKAQAALRAYHAEWRQVIDRLLAPGPLPPVRATLDRLEQKAAAIRLRQAGARPASRAAEAPAAAPRQQADATGDPE